MRVSRCPETNPQVRKRGGRKRRGAPLSDGVQALRAEGAFRVDEHGLALAAALGHRHLAASTAREPRLGGGNPGTRATPGT